MLTFLGLVAVAALILANGYFVAAEFAFVAARRGRLEDAASTGDAKAARAVQVHKRLSFMLSGAQLGITVTSLAVGFIAEPTLGRALEPIAGALGVPESVRFGVALTVGFVLATAAQMVIGCRPLPFESHAWVEVDGRVVNDRQEYQRAFRVLDRL